MLWFATGRQTHAPGPLDSGGSRFKRGSVCGDGCMAIDTITCFNTADSQRKELKTVVTWKVTQKACLSSREQLGSTPAKGLPIFLIFQIKLWKSRFLCEIRSYDN